MIAGFRTADTSRTMISRRLSQGTRSTSGRPGPTAPTCRAKERSLKHRLRESNMRAILPPFLAIGLGCGALIFGTLVLSLGVTHLRLFLVVGIVTTISSTLFMLSD